MQLRSSPVYATVELTKIESDQPAKETIHIRTFIRSIQKMGGGVSAEAKTIGAGSAIDEFPTH